VPPGLEALPLKRRVTPGQTTQRASVGRSLGRAPGVSHGVLLTLVREWEGGLLLAELVHRPMVAPLRTGPDRAGSAWAPPATAAIGAPGGSYCSISGLGRLSPLDPAELCRAPMRVGAKPCHLGEYGRLLEVGISSLIYVLTRNWSCSAVASAAQPPLSAALGVKWRSGCC